MAETWRLIEALYEITEAEGEGTEWQETETRNQGELWQRVVKPIEAIGAAGCLLNAISAGRSPSQEEISRAQDIIRLAEWHKYSR